MCVPLPRPLPHTDHYPKREIDQIEGEVRGGDGALWSDCGWNTARVFCSLSLSQEKVRARGDAM